MIKFEPPAPEPSLLERIRRYIHGPTPGEIEASFAALRYQIGRDFAMTISDPDRRAALLEELDAYWAELSARL